MAPSYSGVWKLNTQYQYRSDWPIDLNLASTGLFAGGQDSSAVINTVQKIIVEVAGDSTDFGDLSAVRKLLQEEVVILDLLLQEVFKLQK